MRLTVHRVEVALYHGDRLQIAWWEHSFRASERVVVDHDNCVNAVWLKSKPVEVDTPPLCRLADVDLPKNPVFPPAVPPARHRLITPFDAAGWDATTVYHAAVRGLRGFRLAYAGEAEKQASPAHAMVRWGIAFASRQLPHHRSFLVRSSRTSTGTLASTLDLRQAARWDTQAEADDWLRGGRSGSGSSARRPRAELALSVGRGAADRRTAGGSDRLRIPQVAVGSPAVGARRRSPARARGRRRLQTPSPTMRVGPNDAVRPRLTEGQMLSRAWDRLKTWCRRRVEQRRLRALEEQFELLESRCRLSGETELAHLISLTWESRCRGEHPHALNVMLIRNSIKVRAAHAQEERRPWV